MAESKTTNNLEEIRAFLEAVIKKGQGIYLVPNAKDALKCLSEVEGALLNGKKLK